MRFRRVTAPPFNDDLELVGRSKERTRTNGECSSRNAGPVVHAVDLLDIPTVHHAVRAHFATTATAFFGGLEDHNDRAVKIPRLCKVFRSAQEHRGMTIVTTSMHRALGFRRIRQTSCL